MIQDTHKQRSGAHTNFMNVHAHAHGRTHARARNTRPQVHMNSQAGRHILHFFTAIQQIQVFQCIHSLGS
jgi:hypothetical protein